MDECARKLARCRAAMSQGISTPRPLHGTAANCASDSTCATAKGNAKILVLSNLRRYPLFNGVSGRVLLKLAGGSELRTIKAGDFVIRSSQEGDSLLVLCKGKVACYERKGYHISAHVRNGHGLLGKETLCMLALRSLSHDGDNAPVHNHRRSSVRASTCVSFTECEILVIPAEHLAGCMALSRKLEQNIRHAASSHLRDLALAGSTTAKRFYERIVLGAPSNPTQDAAVRQKETERQRAQVEAMQRKICTLEVANKTWASKRTDAVSPLSSEPSPALGVPIWAFPSGE
mmetsp:Transcript_13766/g.27495  ORF Transcript_13766/g.27495 Transcript_13766/m.27495 type:complete len:289 (+) Transcript_13766:203-1069(+)